MIKLRTIGREVRLKIENTFEYLLHLADVVPNGDLATQMLLQIRRRGQMIGMRVRFKYPCEL